MTSRWMVAAIGAMAVGLLTAGSASAAFPGTNGRIAFVNDPGTAGSNSDIFAIDPTGANPTQLTTDPGFDFDPSYSPDGEKILFTAIRSRGAARSGS